MELELQPVDKSEREGGVMIWNATPEQRAAAVAKGIETRRRNIAARVAREQEAKSMRKEISDIERQLKTSKEAVSLCNAAKSLSGKFLLTEGQIIESSISYQKTCGVYFLIKDGRVVYVGQSVNIFGRLSQHENEKEFDSISWVTCDRKNMDKLESLYIHVLRPEMNGEHKSGQKHAPLSLDLLLAFAKETTTNG